VTDRRQLLLEEIGQRRDDLVDLTRALVRIPSVNAPGDC
jgi:acetylornithine deacetylase/succinyl-diaminopimelate desuccinylase-like protein